MLTISNVNLEAELVNIRIADGRIAGIENCGKAAGPTSLVVIPGMTDLHVHSRQPNEDEKGKPLPDFRQKEDWDHLYLAAIKGGVTGMAVMPNPFPPIITLRVLEKARKLAEHSSIKPLYWFGTTADRNQKELMRAAEEPDVIGFKLFMCSSTGGMLVYQEEYQRGILRAGAEAGVPVAVHCGDEILIQRNMATLKRQRELRFSDHPDIRSTAVEAAGVRQILRLGKETGCRLHICHVSSVESAALIWQAKQAGQAVTAEVTPHHLFLNRECLHFSDAGYFQMNPPLRSEEERMGLFERFLIGRFDTVGSDHAPHTKSEKAKPYPDCPSGVPGVETTLPLLNNEVFLGNLNWNQLVYCTSTRPAEIAGLKNKGRIAVGYDADLVLIDPARKTRITHEDIISKCGWTPYNGMNLKGKIVATMLGGEFVYDISDH